MGTASRRPFTLRSGSSGTAPWVRSASFPCESRMAPRLSLRAFAGMLIPVVVTIRRLHEVPEQEPAFPSNNFSSKEEVGRPRMVADLQDEARLTGHDHGLVELDQPSDLLAGTVRVPAALRALIEAYSDHYARKWDPRAKAGGRSKAVQQEDKENRCKRRRNFLPCGGHRGRFPHSNTPRVTTPKKTESPVPAVSRPPCVSAWSGTAACDRSAATGVAVPATPFTTAPPLRSMASAEMLIPVGVVVPRPERHTRISTRKDPTRSDHPAVVPRRVRRTWRNE